VYLLTMRGHGQRTSQEKRISPVRSVLDELQAHHTDNFGWALACCGWQRDMADDALQEAYLRVLDGRAAFGGRAAPKTWFFAVIRRVAADMQRTGKRHAILNMRLVADVTDAAAPTSADAVYTDQTSRQLQSALMQLSLRQREVLHLVFYAEMTLEEAAATLDISPGSSRTHYHRGKERLAQLLGLGEEHA
jgi:RNA polymerase sigma-70 factor (ECF subfamily)